MIGSNPTNPPEIASVKSLEILIKKIFMRYILLQSNKIREELFMLEYLVVFDLLTQHKQNMIRKRFGEKPLPECRLAPAMV